MSIIYVEKRLAEWSLWAVNFLNGEYGYPDKSTLASLWEGSDQPRYSRLPFPLSDLRSQETNCLIERMRFDHFRNYEALKAFYLTTITKGELARMSGLSSVRQFERRLHDAKVWLDGAFSRQPSANDIIQQSLAYEPQKVCN